MGARWKDRRSAIAQRIELLKKGAASSHLAPIPGGEVATAQAVAGEGVYLPRELGTPGSRTTSASADERFENFPVAEDGDGPAGRRAQFARRLDAQETQDGRRHVGR